MADVSGIVNLLVEERNKTVDDLKYKIQNYENDIYNLRSENNIYRNTKNNLEFELSSIKNQVYQKDNTINSLQNQYNTLALERNSTVSSLNQQLNSKNQTINQLNNLIFEKDQTIKEQKSKIESLENELNDCEKKNNSSEQKINQLKNELRTKEEKIKDLEDKINSSFTTTKSSIEYMSIRFISTSGTLDTRISCTSSDVFSTLEEKLYQLFPELRNENNIFVTKGKTIQKNQSVDFNQINPGSLIILINNI